MRNFHKIPRKTQALCPPETTLQDTSKNIEGSVSAARIFPSRVEESESTPASRILLVLRSYRKAISDETRILCMVAVQCGRVSKQGCVSLSQSPPQYIGTVGWWGPNQGTMQTYQSGYAQPAICSLMSERSTFIFPPQRCFAHVASPSIFRLDVPG